MGNVMGGWDRQGCRDDGGVCWVAGRGRQEEQERDLVWLVGSRRTGL